MCIMLYQVAEGICICWARANNTAWIRRQLGRGAEMQDENGSLFSGAHKDQGV